MLFETIRNCREHFENKEASVCILTLFETIIETAVRKITIVFH